VTRLVPYKRVDLAISAANLLGEALVVVGDGPDARRLARLAGPTVRLTGRLTDQAVDELLTHAKGVVFPGYDDFGIVPVEAQAAGLPVVAYGRGGALDTVIDGKTGCLFRVQTTEAVADAMQRVDRHAFDSDTARANAARFAADRFRTDFLAECRKALERDRTVPCD
jgi:glycosyltransferase involved in cell wall biosynthesis